MTGEYSRRQVVAGGAGALVLGAGLGVGADRLLDRRDRATTTDKSTAPPPPHAGTHQLGVHLPETPPAHQLASVLTWPERSRPNPGRIKEMLAALGADILAITSSGPTKLLPDGPGDLTVQVGIGPTIVSMFGADLPGARPMPLYRGSDRIPRRLRTGDVVLLVASSDPTVTGPVTARLTRGLDAAAVAWQQSGTRGPSTGPTSRNPFGFHDGVIVPRDSAALERGVWVSSGPVASATVGVIRRFELDVSGFQALSTKRQEEVMGRRKIDGSPLSGGGPLDEIDLLAKSPTGDYLSPARSHARAAHPTFTASPLMMRRSYGFTGTRSDGSATSGLLFVSYQNDLDTFVRTQQRLDDQDDLMAYATATAEVSFLVLPGYDRDRPLGATLPG